jgi:CheY-like chemotaxis protein
LIGIGLYILTSMKHDEHNPTSEKALQILLADDDADDHFLFDKIINTLPFHVEITTVEDGEKLMKHLYKNMEHLPDVLFLDYNMPRSNGSECLIEIKEAPLLKNLPVVIYSTYFHQDIAKVLYENGAYYYVRKTSQDKLKKALTYILTLALEKKLVRPTRDQFILTY